MEILEGIVSSNVKMVKYDPETEYLYIQFLRKKGEKNNDDNAQIEYVYEEVNSEEFRLIKEAESIGSILHKTVRGKRFTKTEVPRTF